MVYLKTTDYCQLNCDHCFTNGTNGKKGWFDIPKTINFFERLKEYHPDYDNANISFHGGEPLLCPTELIFEAYNGIKDLWPNLWWSVQTNLTFPMTSAKESVLTDICQKSWGTSWDKGIRWPDINKKLQWEHNVEMLAADGHEITVMVCLTSSVMEMEPIEIIDYMARLGIKHVNFERVTPNGNALMHPNLFPGNRNLDGWFAKMWDQCVEHETYKYIDNMFMDSILTEIVYNTHAGCRCRQCEQKILTINADGTIGGCPNGAVESQFGHIDDDVETLMTSPGRMCNIQSEVIRNPLCYTCDVFDICNGDCHQLAWEGNVCAAPKTLMKNLKRDNDIELYKKFLGDFMGQE